MSGMYRPVQEPDDLSKIPLQDPEFSTTERKLLYHTNQQIANITTLDGVLDFLYIELGALFNYNSLSLFILEDNQRSAVLQWTRSTDETEFMLRPGFKVDLPNGLFDDPLATGEPLVIGNVDSAPESLHDCQWFTERVQHGMRSCIVELLSVAGRRIGLLVVTAPAAFRFGFHEKKLLGALNVRVSQAIDTAFMVDQLKLANASYLEMLGFVSHELKNPLAAMVMDGKLLMQGYVGDLTQPQQKRIGKIVGKAQYLLGLIREYLDLSRLESGELHARPRHQVQFIKHIVTPSIEMVSSRIEDLEMELVQDLPDSIPVSCDPDLLVIVMVNLLDNAAKYGVAGGKILLVVKVDGSGLHVRIRNDGPGFPESAKTQLFRKFTRVHTKELMKRKGTGVGLYTVWQIIRLHGGTVWAESLEGSWAEFGFHIPQPLRIPA